LTCTPVDRPCVASNRFEMNWNSAIASWLYRGWPPVPNSDVTCWPSTWKWNSRVSLLFLSGSGFSESSLVPATGAVRLPGASSARLIQLRPFTGSSATWRGSMLPPSVDVVVSISGASPLTVSVSATPAGDICRLRTPVCPTSNSTARAMELKP
jgi:hypothetical protein